VGTSAANGGARFHVRHRSPTVWGPSCVPADQPGDCRSTITARVCARATFYIGQGACGPDRYPASNVLVLLVQDHRHHGRPRQGRYFNGSWGRPGEPAPPTAVIGSTSHDRRTRPAFRLFAYDDQDGRRSGTAPIGFQVIVRRVLKITSTADEYHRPNRPVSARSHFPSLPAATSLVRMRRAASPAR